MRRPTRVVAIALVALVFGVPLAGCSDDRTPAQKQADAVAEQQEEARERQEAANEKQEDILGHLMDPTGWNEAEETFTKGTGEDAVTYGIVSTGEVHCSPKFRLDSDTSYSLVAIVSDMDGNDAISLGDLPGPFAANKNNLTKKKFNQLVRAHRDSSPAMGKICKDR